MPSPTTLLLPAPPGGPPASRPPGQASFDELGQPLREVTFVVVDLETTGGSPHQNAITELGAVKVRGGEVLGQMQTLVNPGRPIPAFIAVLTGISSSMVADAPGVDTVLAAFLDFARDCVLVAHNAPFDLGFLKAACAQTGRAWPRFASVDTARLARRVLTRDEVPDCRLSTLARFFHADTEPVHRALADAQATVDVLHALIARLGNLGVHSLEELTTFSTAVPAAVRRKRHLAETLPRTPGVYLFRGPRDRVLYVGTSRDLRSRVRTYFTAAETRKRMTEMVALAERVDHVPTSTALEAAVRELRLIAEHCPPYNRRSKWPERVVYLVLTKEAFPRLSLVRTVRDADAAFLGPFPTRAAALSAMAAVHAAVPLRQCTQRLSPNRPVSDCALAGMGRCGAPCSGAQSVTDYAVVASQVQRALSADPADVVGPLLTRLRGLADQQRFEDAATLRNRLQALVRAASRGQRLLAFAQVLELVAAAPDGAGGWEIHVVRHGRLVASGLAPRGTAPRTVAAVLVATAEQVSPLPGPTPCATAGEMELVLRWLERAGTRLVEITGCWSLPARGAAHLGELTG